MKTLKRELKDVLIVLSIALSVGVALITFNTLWDAHQRHINNQIAWCANNPGFCRN